MNQSANYTYYKYARTLSEDFIKHMIFDIGLTEDQQQICLSIMKNRGNDKYHADNLLMPEGTFRYNYPILKDKQLAELFRLAEIGYAAEKENTEEMLKNRKDFFDVLVKEMSKD